MLAVDAAATQPETADARRGILAGWGVAWTASGQAELLRVPYGDHNCLRLGEDAAAVADTAVDDAIARRLKKRAAAWHVTARLSDQDLAHLVREHRIDILVDLTLHMNRNRLLAFARKPAPVQLTYLGYAASTGLAAMDYRISDASADALFRSGVLPLGIYGNVMPLVTSPSERILLVYGSGHLGWLQNAFASNPRLLIAHQPTRGLDVGAIEFVHRRLVEERDEGRGVLLVSLELEEILSLSDRILVIYEGRIVGEFAPGVSEEELGVAMTGGGRKAAA